MLSVDERNTRRGSKQDENLVHFRPSGRRSDPFMYAKTNGRGENIRLRRRNHDSEEIVELFPASFIFCFVPKRRPIKEFRRWQKEIWLLFDEELPHPSSRKAPIRNPGSKDALWRVAVGVWMRKQTPDKLRLKNTCSLIRKSNGMRQHSLDFYPCYVARIEGKILSAALRAKQFRIIEITPSKLQVIPTAKIIFRDTPACWDNLRDLICLKDLPRYVSTQTTPMPPILICVSKFSSRTED